MGGTGFGDRGGPEVGGRHVHTGLKGPARRGAPARGDRAPGAASRRPHQREGYVQPEFRRRKNLISPVTYRSLYPGSTRLQLVVDHEGRLRGLLRPLDGHEIQAIDIKRICTLARRIRVTCEFINTFDCPEGISKYRVRKRGHEVAALGILAALLEQIERLLK